MKGACFLTLQMRLTTGRTRAEGAASSEGHGISPAFQIGACSVFVACGPKIW